jgi:hypothetical protein
MPIQTIDRGTSGDTTDKFKIGQALDTCQNNDDYLELNKIGTVATFNTLSSTAGVVGKLLTTVCHTSGSYGSAMFEGVSETHAATDGGSAINSATAGIRWRMIGHNGVFTVEQFGCLPTGTAVEQTRAINKAYVAANTAGGFTVTYTQPAYAIDGNIDGTTDDSSGVDPQGRGGIQIKSKTRTLFAGNVFTQAVGAYTSYSLINCSNADDFIIEGQATFIGDALIHPPTGGQYGHGLYLVNCHRFRISDLTIKTCWGDGAYVSDTSFSTLPNGIATMATDGEINDCIFDSNRRQGMSGINGKNFTWNRCQFINTGSLIATAPSAGVDLETDASATRNGMQNWTFNACVMSGNVGPSVLIFPTLNNGPAGCENIEFNNCVMVNTSAQGSFWSDRVATFVKNIRVNGGVIQGGVYAANGTTFNNVKISRSMSDVSTSTYVLEFIAGTHNARFSNCEIRAIGDTTINSKKLLFTVVGPGEANKTTFTKCKFVSESIYGGATNVTLITRVPMTFTECEFLTEGTAPASYHGFDTTANNSRVHPIYAMLYNCYIDPNWHNGVTYFQNRVDLTTSKIRSLNSLANNLVPCGLADVFEFVYPTGAVSNINAPSDPWAKRITIRLKNTSGGAMGAVAWNAIYKMSAWVNPATGFNRSIDFIYDETNAFWYQVGGASIDVAN